MMMMMFYSFVLLEKDVYTFDRCHTEFYMKIKDDYVRPLLNKNLIEDRSQSLTRVKSKSVVSTFMIDYHHSIK